MEYPQILSKINTFIFDVDGVLTDGKIFLHPSGEQIRNMNIKDGYALQLAVKLGYKVIIITGGKSNSIKQRLKGLGIYDIYMGASDKLDVFQEVLLTYPLKKEEILYMGDDVPDYYPMKEVGLPTCPANAAQEIQELSNYVSPLNGGDGCVRDVIEKVLRAQKKWFDPELPNDQQLW